MNYDRKNIDSEKMICNNCTNTSNSSKIPLFNFSSD